MLCCKHNRRTLLLLLLAATRLSADPRCIACHPQEVANYSLSGMARSLAPAGAQRSTPDASFEHAYSKTRFTVRLNGLHQSFEGPNAAAEETSAFVIGSGNHAFGYLVRTGDHLFQSPLSYYTKRQLWDVAPGYEQDPQPDFTRPVTAECLGCHAGKALPLADSVNRYQPSVFASYGITCERCHGDAAAHLKNPARGSILNPAHLRGAARASICEQCHLNGEARIPNPGKAITDFQPGGTLEDFYSTYVAAQTSGAAIKVVSHAEQLALSKCARMSGDKLWCGTCHNPHDKPVEPAAYFRQRCLGCHAATLDSAHAAPGRDCVACHMPQSPAKDGGHTAFTNHRIAQRPGDALDNTAPDTLAAWREPAPTLRERNLAIALVTTGLQNNSSAQVIRGYKMLNHLEKDFPSDAALATTLGSVLMKGKQPAEALKRFQTAVSLKPEYAPYRVNLASALLATGQVTEASMQLQKALELDSLLEPAVRMLAHVYDTRQEPARAAEVLSKYEQAMGIHHPHENIIDR